jgi:hypothetical protein
MKSVGDVREVIGWGCGGGGENAKGEVSVSCFRILSREEGRSQGGGRMLALRWRLRSRASHKGRGARCGGRREGFGPWGVEGQSRRIGRGGRKKWREGLRWRGERTERRLRLSRRWRGTTVTISISQRKATSIGVRPAWRGNAMFVGSLCLVLKWEFMLDAVWRKETRSRLVPDLSGCQVGAHIQTTSIFDLSSSSTSHLMHIRARRRASLCTVSKDGTGRNLPADNPSALGLKRFKDIGRSGSSLSTRGFGRPDPGEDIVVQLST